MIKDKLVRYIFLFICLISFSSIACIPCAKETSVIVVTQAKPKFSASYRSSESFGQVVFKADVEGKDDKLNNVQIITLTPTDVDKKIILEMIKNSRYRLYTDEKKHSPCSVKGYGFTMDFDLPQKINIEVEIGL